MNEPHNMGSAGVWKSIAQKTIDAIRTVDDINPIIVSGDQWSGAHSWKIFNADLILKDPVNNLIYEAHQYFDHDSSGSYAADYYQEGAYPMLGVDRVRPFIEWLQENNLRGFIGEFGVPNDDPLWLPVLENFVSYLKQNGVPATAWAAGPWWGDYRLSLAPFQGEDQPQVNILENYATYVTHLMAKSEFYRIHFKKKLTIVHKKKNQFHYDDHHSFNSFVVFHV